MFYTHATVWDSVHSCAVVLTLTFVNISKVWYGYELAYVYSTLDMSNWASEASPT